MIDIQLFVGCATCGWQQGCPREDLPPSALEGDACEAGGPGPRGGFLLPHVLSPQRLPCPPTPARHLMTCLNPPIPLFKGAYQASVRTRAHATASLFFGRHLMMPYLIHQSHFSRGDQGLRAFHRRPASLLANSGPASDDALSILRTVLFRLPSPEKVYRC